MSPAILITLAFAFCGRHKMAVEGFAAPGLLPTSPRPSHSTSTRRAGTLRRRRREGGATAVVALKAVPDGMHWFVKTEQFCRPFPEVKPHLEAHREWVRSLREEEVGGGGDDGDGYGRTRQTIIASGYRVDENDRPGGGGLMIFAAKDYAAAEELVRCDPLIANGCVDWQLNKWIAETGDISVD